MSGNEPNAPPPVHDSESELQDQAKGGPDQTEDPDSPQFLDSQKRVRTRTERGSELYRTNRDERLSQLTKSWASIVNLIGTIETCTGDMKSLRQVDTDLSRDYDKHQRQQTELLTFFQNTNSKESIQDIEVHVQTMQEHAALYERALSRIALLKQDLIDTMSHHSSSSKATEASSVIARKRAKANAARAEVLFAEKEAAIWKQQAVLAEQEKLQIAYASRKSAELEADLGVIFKQRKAAAAEAEANAMESASVGRGSLIEDLKTLHYVNPAERTEAYIHQHAGYLHDGQLEPNEGHQVQHNLEYAPVVSSCPVPISNMLNVNAPVFDPTPTQNVATLTGRKTSPQIYDSQVHAPQPTSQSQAVTSEFTRFLLKKELLLSRLTSFNDRPEAYAVWKASFKSIMKELNVTPFEEMDLLVKWLGPESSRNALSIRMSNPNDPARGLQRIWERLEERYGCPEMVESALKQKLANFPKLTNKDSKKLYELADILAEIEAAKENTRYHALLAYFDASSGISPIVSKLPYNLQEKWTSRAVSYKRQHDTTFPPFSVFADFIRDMSRIKNDPGLNYENSCSQLSREKPPTKGQGSKALVSARKTELSLSNRDLEKICPLHKTGHSLNSCRGFKSKTLEDRKKFLREKNICFKCCESSKHRSKVCTDEVQCGECGSRGHASAMHIGNPPEKSKPPGQTDRVKGHGGEQLEQPRISPSVTARCTQICNQPFGGKSCAKTLLVKVYPDGHPDEGKLMYAMIDDQSNRSLAKSEFFTLFNLPNEEMEYTISSCAGNLTVSGRRANGLIIESLDGLTQLHLPTLIECDYIPSVREEIPTPEVARHHPHLRDIVEYIPPMDPTSNILLLIGRDLIEAHHVHGQRIGPRHSPYAQKLSLGWVIIGETCLGKVHKPDSINVKKTFVLGNGRESVLKPCDNEFIVQENPLKDGIGALVFNKTKDDDKPALSVEDMEFLKIMDKEFVKGPNGHWVAPLPFRSTRQRLPNNRPLALKRAKSLHASLQRDPNKKDHFATFMKKIFDCGHAEVAPPLREQQECWYLPIFGVYHPKKPDQIRGVFDSSAKFDGVSLNGVLLSGPDLTNSLLGVLLRFRREPVAITADIEQMFHCFHVREDHRDFLRFLWYKDNDPSQEIIDYRMTVHVFGNSPSPAVATYGLHRTAAESELRFGTDVKDFVEQNFYVDDGISSLPTVQGATDLLKRTKEALKVNGNLRLHKIASNKQEVLNAFAEDDLSKTLKGLDFHDDNLPLQHSLGLNWDLKSDCFTFECSKDTKPFTRRGVLSVINSLFDPMGFVAPVTIQGKLFLREFLSVTTDWDKPLPSEFMSNWDSWKDSLQRLRNVQIPRTFSSSSLSMVTEKEVHIFSDASEKAIAAVAYLKTVAQDGFCQLGFILGKAKVAPLHGHTIPRLELCSAVLAVEIAEIVEEHLGIPTTSMCFYTDSKVVLGYINNTSKRFYVYVANRIQRIRKSTNPDQWSYVRTDKNPADSATRATSVVDMQQHRWLVGPPHLLRGSEMQSKESYPLMDPEGDKEIKPTVKTLKTDIASVGSLGSYRFEKFSEWDRLVETFAFLQHICASFQSKRDKSL